MLAEPTIYRQANKVCVGVKLSLTPSCEHLPDLGDGGRAGYGAKISQMFNHATMLLEKDLWDHPASEMYIAVLIIYYS